MRKITFIIVALFIANNSFSQESETKKEESVDNSTYNRWTIEASVGQAKGTRPYQKDYFSSKPNSFFGGIQPNSYALGIRYMFSPIFGVRGRFGYDDLKNQSGSGSKEFRLQQLSFRPEGVINLNKLFKIEDFMGRFNLLVHAGLDVSQVTSKTPNVIENNQNFGITEYNGGVVFGVTPQFRILDKLAIFFDVTTMKNYRQHFNWDGSYSDNQNNLNGEYISASFGLSYSLGNDKIHGDWAKIKDPQLEEIEALDKRVADMETMLNDTDKDGVPDYLDQENNSLAGVAVDTKGRMVDFNKNGVPDELETYFKENGILPGSANANKDNSEEARNLINGGYVSAFFDSGKSKPTNTSSQGLDFILNYLRKNPTVKLAITGHADEIGNNAMNDKLSSARAENIKEILIKAGIDASRISISANGEDTSVDPKSPEARRLVRRATFKVD